MAHFKTWGCIGCRYNCISHSCWPWSSPYYHVKAIIPQVTQVVRMWAFFGVLFVNPFVITYGSYCQSVLTQSVSHLLDNLLRFFVEFQEAQAGLSPTGVE